MKGRWSFFPTQIANGEFLAGYRGELVIFTVIEEKV